MEIISGTVRNVIYANAENGYTVIVLECDGYGDITAVGTLPDCAPGELIVAQGEWMYHPQHGRQFRVDNVEREMPETEHAILQYLASGVVKGVGPATAARIVETFGCDALMVIEETPERLAEVRGITNKKALEIGKSFAQKAGIRRIMEFLAQYGLPVKLSIKLFRSLGDSAVSILKNNPYILSDEYYGVGFENVDNFALNLGYDENSPQRVEAGVVFELIHNLNNGHSFIPRDKLVAATALLLNVKQELCDIAVDKLAENGKIEIENIAGLDACYLYDYYEAEIYIAKRIITMAKENLYAEDIEELIDCTQREQGIIYTDKQRHAVHEAATKRLMLLTGGPGTGKTTSIKGIVAIFDHMELSTVLAAPTGRAAKRLSEMTGTEAVTIHRLLEAGYDKESGNMCFAKGEKDKLDAEAVIVDECSMVDLILMRNLLSALSPECRLVLVGDANQLPSVGAGNVFADLINSGIATTVRLSEIFRQAKDSDIVVNAHSINMGVLPDLNKNTSDFFFMRRCDPERAVKTITELCAVRLPQRMGIQANQIQVLSPHRRGITGTLNLNRELQNILNPPSENKAEKRFREFIFREGDRVMQIKNNYDTIWEDMRTGSEGAGVYNGDIGIIEHIEDEIVTVVFDDKRVLYTEEMLSELEPAFAVTVHKAQGSEYKAVILAAVEVPRALCSRKILYTAVTRARELFIIVGDDNVISQMTANYRLSKRYSGLKIRLAQ